MSAFIPGKTEIVLFIIFVILPPIALYTVSKVLDKVFDKMGLPKETWDLEREEMLPFTDDHDDDAA